jgi:hypothetical protein
VTLRDQIAAKSRRTVVVPVQVTDLGEDGPRAAQARTLALAAQVNGSTTEQIDAALAALDVAAAAVHTHFADVEFRALSPDDFEALVARNTDGAGDINRTAFCAELAAACAVDESVNEAGWWATQFASGSWSKGEFDSLYHALFTQLNYSAPGPALPKG